MKKLNYMSAAVSVFLLMFLVYSYIWPGRSFSAPIDVAVLLIGAVNLVVTCILVRKAKRKLKQAEGEFKKADEMVNREDIRLGIN